MDRVLVFGLSNNLGGTEMVISNIARALEERVTFDFLVAEEVTAFPALTHGMSKFWRIPVRHRDPVGYYHFLRRFFKEHAGEYAAFWINKNNVNNLEVLRVAKREGQVNCILHMHSAKPKRTITDRAAQRLNAHTISRADKLWACSSQAGAYHFGRREFDVIRNAVDRDSFTFNMDDRRTVRTELGVLEGTLLVGTVGRLRSEKNQAFMIDMMVPLLERQSDAKLLLVGDGGDRAKLEQQARTLGVKTNVIFAGARTDIGPILSALDVFCFPSKYEGLGISLVEAQFNGLPCVISDRVPDAAVISDGVSRLGIGVHDVEHWANTVIDGRRSNVKLLDFAEEYDMTNQAENILDRMIA